MEMKRLIGMGLVSLLGMGLLSGCPTSGTTTPDVPTASSLKGKVMFQGTGKSGLTVRLKRYDGANWATIDTTSTTANDGSYSFKDLANGNYQAFYDDKGEVVSAADVNTAGAYVTDPKEVSSTQGSTPTIDFDVYWPVNPNPTPNAAFNVNQSFSWAPNPNASGAEYQVLVADSGKSGLWSSGWSSANSVAWNGNRGTETNSPTGTEVAGGSYFYQIKFRKAGGTYGGGNFYGQTKWIPFTFSR
ncbi:MAG TPA: hypothetical protein DD435_14860 [Cyanobacteria bacterium UBA8530]|nr:hypothetical protein [Cyanobacteria bacterium UBA8530]